MSYVVIVSERADVEHTSRVYRVFGPYRSFKRASDDALAWGNAVIEPIEDIDAPEPWNPLYHHQQAAKRTSRK